MNMCVSSNTSVMRLEFVSCLLSVNFDALLMGGLCIRHQGWSFFRIQSVAFLCRFASCCGEQLWNGHGVVRCGRGSL